MEVNFGALEKKILGEEKAKNNARERAESHARKAWKQNGIEVPEGYKNVRVDFFDNGDNPEVRMSNFKSDQLHQAPILVTVSHSSKQKDSEEMTRVSRDGKTAAGFGFEISLTTVKGQKPEMWISINRPNNINSHSGSNFVIEPDFDISKISEIFPEFASEIPASGHLDVKATLAALSKSGDSKPMPFILKK